jgi:alginate O-acetyltransferase complex protein AlgI
MVFNSLPFFIFILIFFPLYFGTRGQVRTWVCLVASYVFYAWWNPKFLFLVAFTAFVDWFLGMCIGLRDEPADARLDAHRDSPVLAPLFRMGGRLAQRFSRDALLRTSIVMNLGVLGFFKYFNFFAESFAALVRSMGMQPSWTTLHIILPIGISFYTFQSMSYTIDVWRKEIRWEPSLLRFVAFTSLFPQLVAGPIVRARDFLHQMSEDKPLVWAAIYSGLGRVFWGLFKKMAIADSIAPYVDQCFAAPAAFGSLHLLIGVVFYSVQIYCDFSGYSDIAIGLARMMGYRFPENFRTPYFSKSFSEFWTRWHISLSSWLRDYLYIPLGGNRHGTLGTYKNNMLTMLLGGLWHGANLAFVFWGFLHGLYLIVQRMTTPVWRKIVRTLRLPAFVDDALAMLSVYALTLFAWVYFRSGSVGLAGGDSFATANAVLGGIWGGEGFEWAAVINKFQVTKGVLVIGILLLIEVSNPYLRWNDLQVRQPWFRLLAFAALCWLIALFGTFGSSAFIYFQF